MAAEGWQRTAPTSFGKSGFNGAAAGWPRKDVQRENILLVMGGLQWGRGRMAAEGVRIKRVGCCGSRFNGAAAGWPRKAQDCARMASAEARLQWGRGRMAAEGRTCLRALSSPSQLQWGRGRMAAEG